MERSQRSLEDAGCICTMLLISNVGGHPAAIQLSTKALKIEVPFRLWDRARLVNKERRSFL